MTEAKLLESVLCVLEFLKISGLLNVSVVEFD